MVVITAIKLILWGIICQAGVTARLSTAATTGLLLGGIFTAMDLAMFHFYLGAETNLHLAAILLFPGHAFSVSGCALLYHRVEDLFTGIGVLALGAVMIAGIVPRYGFIFVFGAG